MKHKKSHLTDDPVKFRERVAEVLKEELETFEHCVYVSFATQKKFLGAVFIQAHGITDALTKINALNLNPGNCQVMSIDVPAQYMPPKSYFNRLLQRKDLEEIWDEVKTLGELEDEYDKGRIQ